MKFKALALVAMLFSTSAFAADFQSVDLTTAPVDVAAEATTAFTTNYVSAAAVATDPFATNVALIQQDAIDNYTAVIDQSGGGLGNFAAISQIGTAVGIAYIGQVASSNGFALIKQ